MVLNDPLANVLSQINTADGIGTKKVVVRPNSKVIRAVLGLLQDNHYLGEFKENKQDRSLEVNLIGSINKTGVIKPKYSIKVEDYKKFEKRYLPAFGFGFLVVTTNKGIMTQEQAIKLNLGGKLLAYVY